MSEHDQLSALFMAERAAWQQRRTAQAQFDKADRRARRSWFRSDERQLLLDQAAAEAEITFEFAREAWVKAHDARNDALYRALRPRPIACPWPEQGAAA